MIKYIILKGEKVIKVKSVFKVIVAVAASMVFMAPGIKGTSLAADATGTKLPADGGEPGKDYVAYLNALRTRNGAAIRKLADVGPISDKELNSQMGMMAAMTPTDQKIISGTANEDTAVLKVTGTLEGKKHYGTIEMKKKDGVWKITKEDWSETGK